MVCFYIWLFLQILLESFPISSSGHTFLFEQYAQKFGCHIDHYIQQLSSANFSSAVPIDLLDHFAHGATVIILALYFFPQWFFLVKNMRRCWRIILKLILMAGIADVITALFYVVLKKNQINFPVGLGFLITAAILASLRWVPRDKKKKFDFKDAIILGIVQGCALLPGISRLAATYACGRFLGLSSRKSFATSWMIAWPLITAAFLNSVRILASSSALQLFFNWPTMAVITAASIISYYALRYVGALAQAEKLWRFSFYMFFPITLWLLL